MGTLNKHIEGRLAIGLIIVVFLGSVLMITLANENTRQYLRTILVDTTIPAHDQAPLPLLEELKDIKQFVTEQEFKDYLADTKGVTAYSGSIGGAALDGGAIRQPLTSSSLEGGAAIPTRISETTVQVAGIDEPDIVKTDGKEIYFSQGIVYGFLEPIPFEGEEFIMPSRIILPSKAGEIKVIKAFPPSAIKEESKIEQTGDLLLQNDVLIVFSGKEIYGYDVSNPKSPEEKWKIEFERNNILVDARLYQDKIYLVTKHQINRTHPCPIQPFAGEGKSIIIPCKDIYYPSVPVPINVTFIAMVLNPVSGDIEEKVSFVGSSGTSVVYMSTNAIYITYSYSESFVEFFSDFLHTEANDLFSESFLKRVQKLSE